MKWLFACGLFMSASLAQAQVSDVVICGGCSTVSSYENAARQAAGTNFNGERQILVINAVTNISRHVLVTNTPVGEVPWAVDPGSPTLHRYSKPPVAKGAVVELKHNPDATIVFVDSAQPSNSQASGSTTPLGLRLQVRRLK